MPLASLVERMPWYTRPPPPSFWDRIPQDTIFYGIMGVNGLVCGMWCVAHWKAQANRDRRVITWMHDNFRLSWRNITSGRVWTLVTSFFSHDIEEPHHILLNGYKFYYTARLVLESLGNKSFLFLYIGSGVAANVINLAWRKLVSSQDDSSLGAGAATYSVVSFLACTAPKLTLLYGIIPIPIWAFATGTFAYNTYSAVTDRQGGADAAGHVAGLIAGAGVFLGRSYRIF